MTRSPRRECDFAVARVNRDDIARDVNYWDAGITGAWKTATLSCCHSLRDDVLAFVSVNDYTIGST